MQTNCVVCGNNLIQVIDLGDQPLANNLLKIKSESTLYPLSVYRCKNCSHSQINYFVNHKSLFSDYVYVSGTSNTMKTYFKQFARKYDDQFKHKHTKNILEIACNDCSQLSEFYDLGWSVYGVDPAENIIKNVKNSRYNLECKFWGKDDIGCIKGVELDLIVAQNVVAHVTNPLEFIQKCLDVMNDNTILVIQTSQSEMYIRNQFDTIYHEHISFFTVKSMITALDKLNARLISAYKTDVHGISYVFEIKKGHGKHDTSMLEYEKSIGLYDDYLYNEYTANFLNVKNEAISVFRNYKEQSIIPICYGAAAKGITFLNYIFNSSHSDLCPEFIIDESTYKINKYVPGILSQITTIDVLKNITHNQIAIIILAWNFKDEIVKKLKEYTRINDISNIKEIIVFFPSYEVIRF